MSDAIATQEQDVTGDLMKLHRLCTGYLSSKAIFSALELGVFEELEKQPGTAEDVAHRLGLGERAVRVLLLALLGDGIVTRNNERYANSAVARLFLTRGGAHYFGGFIEHQETHFPNFARWTEALKREGPLTGPMPVRVDGQPAPDPPP